MPEWFVSEAPSDSVARTRFGAAATAPRVRVSDAALDHRTVWFEVLPGRGQAELLEAAERGQISGQEGGPLPLILDTLSDGFRPRYRAYRASPPRTHSERRSRSLSAASSCCTGSPTGTPPGTRSPHQGTLPTPREALVSKPR